MFGEGKGTDREKKLDCEHVFQSLEVLPGTQDGMVGGCGSLDSFISSGFFST